MIFTRNNNKLIIETILVAIVVLVAPVLMMTHHHSHTENSHCDDCRVVQSQVALPAIASSVDGFHLVSCQDEFQSFSLPESKSLSAAGPRAPPFV